MGIHIGHVGGCHRDHQIFSSLWKTPPTDTVVSKNYGKWNPASLSQGQGSLYSPRRKRRCDIHSNLTLLVRPILGWKFCFLLKSKKTPFRLNGSVLTAGWIILQALHWHYFFFFSWTDSEIIGKARGARWAWREAFEPLPNSLRTLEWVQKSLAKEHYSNTKVSLQRNIHRKAI